MHGTLGAEQDVMGVQIRVTYAKIVETAQATADLDPGEDRDPTLRERCRERYRACEPPGDQVTPIGEPVPCVAGGDGRCNRQARVRQVIGQVPLGKRPRRGLAAPEIVVGRQACRETAAPIVTQRVLVAAIGKEQCRAPARRLTRDRLAFAPIPGVEPVDAQIAHPGSVI